MTSPEAWISLVTLTLLEIVLGSYRDVAAELELPVGTVRSRAHYALRGLRRSLERADLAA